MTNRQANIYNAIKEAFEEVDEIKKHFSAEEIQEYYRNLIIIADNNELTKIKELAMLYALSRFS